MKSAVSSPRGLSSAAAITLGIAAALVGIAIPPAPLFYRGAWGLALVASLLWVGALYVFFVYFAGPGLLAHLALWLLALVGLVAPRRLARLEAQLRRLAGGGRPEGRSSPG
jgi:hypothetical protein